MASDDVRALAERLKDCVVDRDGDVKIDDCGRFITAAQAIHALARALLAQETRPTWQPISSAPKNIPLLLWDAKGGEKAMTENDVRHLADLLGWAPVAMLHADGRLHVFRDNDPAPREVPAVPDVCAACGPEYASHVTTRDSRTSHQHGWRRRRYGCDRCGARWTTREVRVSEGE